MTYFSSSRNRAIQLDRRRSRAYVLLSSRQNQRKRAATIVGRQAGMVAVDVVEGPPDIVFVIEAPGRQELASVLIRAMASIQDMTESMEPLPATMPREPMATTNRNATNAMGRRYV